MRKTLMTVLMATCGLGGCATVGKTGLPVPEPELVVSSDERLMCVSAGLDERDRDVNFTVLEFPDKTGKINTTGGADATGAFNTQGAENMVYTALGRTGLDVVYTSEQYRKLWQWQGSQLAGSKTTWASLAITGAITSTDFVGGKGFDIEIGGVGGGVYSNTILQSIDLAVLTLPNGKQGVSSGEQVAEVTVQTEIKQKGIEVSVASFDPIGNITKKYVAVEAGSIKRAPLQYTTRAMVEFALAVALARIFKVEGCLPPEATTTIAATK